MGKLTISMAIFNSFVCWSFKGAMMCPVGHDVVMMLNGIRGDTLRMAEMLHGFMDD